MFLNGNVIADEVALHFSNFMTSNGAKHWGLGEGFIRVLETSAYYRKGINKFGLFRGGGGGNIGDLP